MGTKDRSDVEQFGNVEERVFVAKFLILLKREHQLIWLLSEGKSAEDVQNNLQQLVHVVEYLSRVNVVINRLANSTDRERILCFVLNFASQRYNSQLLSVINSAHISKQTV